MSQLAGAQIKYFHVIYKAQKDGIRVRSVDIARELGVTKASVSRMLKSLTDTGLLAIREHGDIMLTPKGICEGITIYEKVSKVYDFFSKYLELEASDAINSTYSFVCGFSDDCVSKLLDKEWDTVQKTV